MIKKEIGKRIMKQAKKIIEKKILKDACEIFSLPEAIFRLQEAINNDKSSANDIVSILEADSSLLATTLKIANSAAYGQRRKIDEARKAVVLLGLEELNRVLLTAVATNKINKNIPPELDMNKFWRETLFCSYFCQEFGKKIINKSIFTAGMLHNIGTLFLFKEFPKKQEKIEEISHNNNYAKLALERDQYGFNSVVITTKILEQWHLPDIIINAVKFQESPDDISILNRIPTLILYSGIRLSDQSKNINENSEIFADISLKFTHANLSISLEALLESRESAIDLTEKTISEFLPKKSLAA